VKRREVLLPPGFSKTSKVFYIYIKSRSVLTILPAGIGGKGGEGDTEGGAGGAGGSTNFRLSADADYKFGGIECEVSFHIVNVRADQASTAGMGGEGGPGKYKGGKGGVGGNFTVEERELRYSECCIA
jgi:hypothetical protein